MNFLLNVIKIFFKNKRIEIKLFFHTTKWYHLAEMLIMIGVVIVVVSLCFGISYGTGYLLMDVLGWIDIHSGGETTTPYTAIGILFYVGIFLLWIVGYGTWHFIKWMGNNIKLAVAEAKKIS